MVHAFLLSYFQHQSDLGSVYEKLAQAYYDETGVVVHIETVKNNYEKELLNNRTNNTLPTIFHILSFSQDDEWEPFCIDLSNTEIYHHLLDKSFSLQSDEPVYGISAGEKIDEKTLYFAVNKFSSIDQQRIAQDFINWIFTSELGKNYVTNELRLTPSFDTFIEEGH
ncbi:MAG: hypothetical protein RSD33_10610 [Clostridium sp.]